MQSNWAPRGAPVPFATTPEMRILVGVDFGKFPVCTGKYRVFEPRDLTFRALGTTFSGLAFVVTDDPITSTVITKWGPGVPTGDKVPTVLAYANRGITGPFQWGYQVRSGVERHEWFKLRLEPEAHFRDSELADEHSISTAYPALDERDSEKLVIDYLSSLKDCAEWNLSRTWGNQIVQKMAVEYIITVPAIWTDKAQFKMRSCAEKAGMGKRDTIQIVSEPEAAGMYALESMPTLGLGINDTFVVCDAGGGTVDLVSYTVKAREPSPVVIEAAPGLGDLCGSTFLNRRFNKWIEKRFERHNQWFEDGYHSDVTDWFEKDIKPRFLGKDDEVYKFRVRNFPDNPVLGITDGTFRVTAKDLRDKVFEPVITSVQKLVLAQIGKTQEEVKHVLLCGGFGQSDYLKARLQDVVGGNIDVLQVPNSNTAVVRGALIRGLTESSSDSRYPNARVDSRMARRHFGTCCWEQYDPTIHEKSRREYHPYTGGYRVKMMRWFVRKGESVKTKERKIFPFYYETPVTTGWTKTVDTEVFACDDDVPPPYETPAVKQIVKLNIDLSGIPTEEMIVLGQKNGAVAHYKVDFDVEMTLDSAKLSFSMFHQGKRHSTVHADFD